MGSKSRRMLTALGMPVLLMCLSACDRLLPGSGPPPQLYQLSPKNTFPATLHKVPWQLTIEVPFASSALNTTRIAIMPTAVQIDYYAKATWTDRIPVMVQTLIVESFENSHLIVGIGRDTIGLRSDFVLKTELREFQSESYNPQGGLVRVAIDAKLVQMPARTIIAATEFREVAPAIVDDLNSVIGAYDEALGRVMKKMVAWTINSGSEAYRPPADAVSGGAFAPTAPAGPASPPVSPRRPAANPFLSGRPAAPLPR